MSSKVWFITGTSRGFGAVWANAALERGDKVAATARNTDSLSEMVEKYGDSILPIQLDVTDKPAVDAAVKQAHEHFGSLDVVINNAGYGLFGMVEEISEEEARSQIETNVFGALWVTQAALPIMREQGSGHIIQVSSIGGVQAFPSLGLYHASKWALEGFTQSLYAEVRGFGINVSLIEPGGFDTDWSGDSAVRAQPLSEYDELRGNVSAAMSAVRSSRGNPEATGQAVLKLVDAEDPPLRVFFGKAPLPIIEAEYESRLANWREWNNLAVEAHGEQE